MWALLPVLLLFCSGNAVPNPPEREANDQSLQQALDAVNTKQMTAYEAAKSLGVRYSRLKWYLKNGRLPKSLQKDASGSSAASSNMPSIGGGGERISVCAMAKNEARYLKEWLTFHKCAGFDHFYVL